ncbi:hypothetical protein AB0F36_14185 [Streptomyces sp. NPDC029080]|uniref:hypothetical protein n=1 Tax=Streptomyces sp. NPDC029080 TaxID=3155017 RepID=UPI0034040839
MHIQYSDDDIAAKAAALGLIEKGEPLPRHLRGRVVAAMLQEQAPAEAAAHPEIADEIVIQPSGVILIDGARFPWLVAKEPIDVRVDPEGINTVRMTLFANTVQIIKSEPREEQR